MFVERSAPEVRLSRSKGQRIWSKMWRLAVYSTPLTTRSLVIERPDDVFEIDRVQGVLSSIAEVHAIVARAHLA